MIKYYIIRYLCPCLAPPVDDRSAWKECKLCSSTSASEKSFKKQILFAPDDRSSHADLKAHTLEKQKIRNTDRQSPARGAPASLLPIGWFHVRSRPRCSLSSDCQRSPRAAQPFSPLCSSCKLLLHRLGGSTDTQINSCTLTQLSGVALGGFFSEKKD